MKTIHRLRPGIIAAYSLILATAILAIPFSRPAHGTESTNAVQASPAARRVNIPYWASGAPYPSRAVFWFGKVDATNNYADVRLIYDDTQLKITAHVIDRRLVYDTSPSTSDLTQWDAVTLYLDKDGNNGSVPSSNTYRFDAQVTWFEDRQNYQTAYKGNGSTWVSAPVAFTTVTAWRGDGVPNDTLDDKGWEVNYTIPFSSLGLSGPPASGSIWGLALAVHDRDEINGPVLPDTIWPEMMDKNLSSTWGQMRFGIPGYNAPAVTSRGIVMISQGVNGASVPDAAVGGSFNCGDPYGPSYWAGWGSANWAGDSQINIQNQWDIADWPCFSKYFVTFPVDAVPNGMQIISATLTMYLTGTAGGGAYGNPPDSYIQVFTVGENWSESTITWNNAPLAIENISGTWVHPKTTALWPTYTWDVSRAVADAYAAGKPLRLALYSADGDYHTGKYFTSSDWSDIEGRPNLQVRFGSPSLQCNSPGISCTYTYVPFILKR